MIDIITLFDAIRLSVGIVILSIASYTDVKTRKASNILWVVIVFIGVLLLLIQYYLVGFTSLYPIIFIPIMIVLIYVFFQLRLIFGGADAKALMALSILAPIEPSISNLPIIKSFMPFSWVIFTNSVLTFLVLPISLFFFNLIKGDIKFPHIFFGYKMSTEKAKEKFVWPLEKFIDGKMKFSYLPKEFNNIEDLTALEKEGIDEIWVTPKFPFMISLLTGFVFSFLFGDILFYIMNNIF